MMTLLVRKGTLVLAFALFALLISSSPAEAHALLLRSDPAGDARLFDPPGSVTGWFSEPLEAGVSSLKVVDATGARVDLGDTHVDAADPTKMTVSLQKGIGPGFYLVSWETLSRIDGHFRIGSFQFAVLNPNGSLPPQPAFGGVGGGRDEVDMARSLAKALSLIGQVGLVGGLAFFLLVARPAARHMQTEQSRVWSLGVVRRHLAVVAFGSAGLLALVGLFELTIQIRDVPRGPSLSEVLATSWGERWLQKQVALLATAALLLCQMSLARRQPQTSFASWLALLAGLTYLLLTSLTSHAAALQRGELWATGFDLVHLLAAAVWVGGLAQLSILMVWTRHAPTEPAKTEFRAKVLHRFSLLAATAAIPLLASGVLNALVQVPKLADLVETSYGLALTAKLVIVFLLLAVAAVNAFMLRPGFLRAFGEGEPTEKLGRLLSRLVPLEATLGVLVLVVTGVLSQLTTARALAQIAGKTVIERGSALSNPLASADFGLVILVALITLGALGLIWTSRAPGCTGWFLRNLSRAAVALPSLILVIVLLAAALEDERAAAPGSREQRVFQPQLSLLRQASENRFVSLQVEPFQPGDNLFRATVLDRDFRPVAVDSLSLRFSRLEREEFVGEITTELDSPSGSFFANFELKDTGWWAVEALMSIDESATFYVKLDSPSRAPDSFATPDYASDAQAQAFLQRALARYEGLSSVRWAEQLTSGHAGPSGYGIWFITLGEAITPDKLHFQVLDMNGPRSNRYFIDSRECSATDGGPVECSSSSFRPDVFDLDYMQPTAFKFGRREMVDGEMTQVVLMYNPNQPAWYAWWVGEESGLLRRQAMVAAGHFMLTRFAEHNAPLTIQLPDGARP